jgi:uncharacterized protein (TIGR02646 family)
MRRIHKGREPLSLATHRRDQGTYKTYAHLDDLRATLLEEQGAICCYCMKSISMRNMRIEHWDAQSEFLQRTVDYDNLLGACTGGENILPPEEEHCDKARGSKTLHVHPARYPPSCEQLIQYGQAGDVKSADVAVNDDLDKVLNLNTDTLKKARARALSQLMSELLREKAREKKKKQDDGFWSPELLAQVLERWRSRDKAGAHREFCQVGIYYLEKKLEKLKKKA